MIIDVQRFAEEGRPHWRRLEEMLDRMESDAAWRMDLREVQEFHLLYRRATADLAEISTFVSEKEIRGHLESLVARAYEEAHETRGRPHRFRPLDWFLVTFPRTFRRHAGAFGLAVAVTVVGALFGGGAIALDPEAKAVLMPFPHLQQDPSRRVADEERANLPDRHGGRAAFSSFLMTHNTRVSILTMSLGMTWGIGTLVMLFYNGVILGAVALDYALAGEAKFLLGWLLPHGAVEIPAILLAGQAGFVLGRALLGRGQPEPLGARLRAAGPDVVTLMAGVALLLVWAGLIESFFSQYHEPVLPYAVKIAFGVLELALLAGFLARAGAGRPPPAAP